jgi:CRP-like cAMP-binding protein
MLFNIVEDMVYNNLNIEQCLEGPFSFFRDLTDEEKMLLSQDSISFSFTKGDIIYHEGGRPSGLYCLAFGKVKVFKEGIGGREQIIRMVRPQGLIGFSSFFAGTKYSTSAVAIEESGACWFSRDQVMKLLRGNTDLMMKFMRMMALELSFSNARTVSLTQKYIRGRLAESLLVLRDTYGVENDGKTIKAYVSREDLACLSNMTTSNAIRTLSVFAAEEVIALEGKKISIVNPARLEKISHMG